MRKRYLAIALLFSALALNAAEPFRIMFYNVENLFDCQHDTLKNDNEFLPTSVMKWDEAKYNDKLSKISKVIIATSNKNVPEDRKSTRLNSSHQIISYAVFCLK